MHALKYGGWIRIGPAMAERMSRLSWPADVARERAGIVPVPLARSRKRDRGFNQSEILASHLSQIWGVPMLSTALARGHGTRSQTQLTPGERLGNVAGAFVVPHSARKEVIGRHLVLVDDVVTTGSTLGACAQALFAAGARTISYMTFGRAPASGDRLIP
ncbi:MAG: ComF family protein [Gemmatimonadaceae bacterium]